MEKIKEESKSVKQALKNLAKKGAELGLKCAEHNGRPSCLFHYSKILT